LKEGISMKTVIFVLKELSRRFNDHQLQLTGSSLAYFFLLALFPLLILLNALLGLFGFAMNDVLISIAPLIPNSAFEILESYLLSISNYDNTVLISFGFLGTIFTTSIAVTSLMNAIYRAYDQKNHRSWLATQGLFIFFTFLIGISLIYDQKNHRSWLATQGLFIFFTFLIGISLILTLLFPLLGQGFIDFISQYVNIPQSIILIWHVFRWVATPIIMMITLAALYKIVPYTPYKQTIWPGTFFAVFGWLSMSIFLSFYINQIANFSFVYGSIGAIIALLIWLFFTGIIIILGAELNDIIDHLKNV